MKRARSEQIQYTVAQYLRRRQYVDADVTTTKNQKLSQSPEEMAANLTGNNEGGRCQRGGLWMW